MFKQPRVSKRKTQSQKLLAHLKNNKSITRIEALFLYQIQNITARISDLRGAGHKIRTDIRMDANGADYARYRLV